MFMSTVRIRNFRSIDDISLDFQKLSAISGPNSCGKSNILKSILFALNPNLSTSDVYENLISTKRDLPGAPKLSIYIDIVFEECPVELLEYGGALPGITSVTYKFRVTRSGTITREINSVKMTDLDMLLKHINIVYVPPIRDLKTDGLDPLKKVFAEAINKVRASATLKARIEATQSELVKKAQAILSNHSAVAKDILHADSIDIDIPSIDINNLIETITLTVKSGANKIMLSEYGTGHQSSVILNLYRQLGEITSSQTIYLFEEPDNHLHPATIRAIGDDLIKLSVKAQIIITTHSPIMLNHFGYERIIGITTDDNKITIKRNIDLSVYNGKDIKILLNQYGIRFTEPLLCRKVVLVEGPCDVTVLSTLITLKCKKTPDQLDILFIPAGGKDGVVALHKFIRSIDAECIVVLDWDAAFNNKKQLIVSNTIQQKLDEIKDGVDKILPQLELSYKRGRKAKTILKEIYNEALNGLTKNVVYDGSQIDAVVRETKSLNAADRDQLKRAIKDKSKTKYQQLLKKAGVWLWSGAIEDAILQATGSEDIVERSLIELGKLDQPVAIASQRRSRLINILHESAHEPLILQQVVMDLETAHKFTRTELSIAVNLILENVNC